MRIRLARAFAFLALANLAGCAMASVFSAETEERAPAFNHAQLEQLVGSTKEEVHASLGTVQYELVGEKKSYFVYQEYVNAAGVVWFILPFPAWGEDVELRCSMLEFDDSDVFSRFELTVPLHFKVVTPDTPKKDCRAAFWTQDELSELNRVLDINLKGGAESGDPEVMYEYASSLTFSNRKISSEALRWYCLAAQRGHAEARLKMGLYNRSGYVAPGQNLVMAYVWYTLSFEAGYATAEGYRDRLTRVMTPAQIAEAERLVAEWEPNPAECEEIAARAES